MIENVQWWILSAWCNDVTLLQILITVIALFIRLIPTINTSLLILIVCPPCVITILLGQSSAGKGYCLQTIYTLQSSDEVMQYFQEVTIISRSGWHDQYLEWYLTPESVLSRGQWGARSGLLSRDASGAHLRISALVQHQTCADQRPPTLTLSRDLTHCITALDLKYIMIK